MVSVELDSVKRSLSRVIRWFWLTAVLILGYFVVDSGQKRWSATQEHRREAICPSLLSISRSARDTLLVMKAEPLCNSFVLESLK